MNRLTRNALAAALVSALMVVPALAGQTASHKGAANPAKSAKAMKCPKCGMPLSGKKTAKTPVAVKIAGKTMHCCKACGAHTAKAK